MQVRIRSTRAPYRRAGLVFENTTDWQQFEGETFDRSVQLRLAGDPVLKIEVRDNAEAEWEPVPEDARKGAFQMVHAGQVPATEYTSQQSGADGDEEVGAPTSSDPNAPADDPGPQNAAPNSGEGEDTGSASADLAAGDGAQATGEAAGSSSTGGQPTTGEPAAGDPQASGAGGTGDTPPANDPPTPKGGQKPASRSGAGKKGGK